MIGLKRIGIILSVLWVVIGGLWVRGKVLDDMGFLAKLELHNCTTLHPDDTDQCYAKFDAMWQHDVPAVWLNINTAIWTFVPLLLAWVLFYIIARLTRWVAAGFRQDAERKLSNS
jgi:hypothetical protein